MSEEASPNTKSKRPLPTNAETTDYALGAIMDSNPWKETVNMLKDVYTDGINFEQNYELNLDSDEESEWAPTTEQAERMHKFLEENPEFVLGTANIDREQSLEISPKWEAVVTELNSLGENEDQPALYWAQYWAKMNNDIHVILAHRENPTPESPAYMIHPLSEVMEQMIVLVQRAASAVTPGESALQNEDIERDTNAEPTGNDGEAAEQPAGEPSSSAPRVHRVRRNRAREQARSTIAMLQRLTELEYQQGTNRITAKKLSIFSDSVSKLTEFFTQCDSVITEEIRRNSIPN